MKKIYLLIVVSLLLGDACTAVKEYEKVYLNDPDMVLSPKAVNRFENQFSELPGSGLGG